MRGDDSIPLPHLGSAEAVSAAVCVKKNYRFSCEPKLLVLSKGIKFFFLRTLRVALLEQL